VLSNETLVLLDAVSALGYEVVFCRLAGLRAVGCVSVSDNRLVNELHECRIGSTESCLGFSHKGAIPVYCTCAAKWLTAFFGATEWLVAVYFAVKWSTAVSCAAKWSTAFFVVEENT
jgi:hypothetical protein